MSFRPYMMWPWRSTIPGVTYIPVASMTRSKPGVVRRASALGVRDASVPNSLIGRAGRIVAIVDPSTMMSIGPRAGFPAPSTTIALRISSRLYRTPGDAAGAKLCCADTEAPRHTTRPRVSGERRTTTMCALASIRATCHLERQQRQHEPTPNTARTKMKLIALSCLIAQVTFAQGPVVPKAGLTITRSTAIRPGVYRLPAPDTTGAPLITVRGNGITLDLAGVELIGAPPDGDPDAARGVAILVDSGANVTIRNGRIRGYKTAIMARGTRNLRLLDNNLSFNWKPRLYSLVEHESLADWLSYHQNEKDEWMRFGAAMYLVDIRGGEVRGNTVHQGMNGLLMTRTDSLLVWNNDFSFNSGLGIGMYRSDHNRIMHNVVDYNVRGYSEGFYRRGQDSAGILIYEQSDSNTVAFNSVTHGGDGLFVWAGQHTMDTGQGGVNDNLFFRNDFSWAPTNAMELTFSRNVVIGNRAVGSDYGLWGGYSYGSLIANNTFERNRVGIAIEHGQDNRILGNTFHRDSTQIWLWANRIEPSDWG